MRVCSYLVIPAPGAAASLAERLRALPGCEVFRAENRELFILVTETDSPASERALRAALERSDDIASLLVAFGQLDPDGDKRAERGDA